MLNTGASVIKTLCGLEEVGTQQINTVLFYNIGPGGQWFETCFIFQWHCEIVS